MDRWIVFLLCLTLICQPVWGTNLVGEAMEGSLEEAEEEESTQAPFVLEEEEESGQAAESASFVAEDPSPTEGESPEGLAQGFPEEAAQDAAALEEAALDMAQEGALEDGTWGNVALEEEAQGNEALGNDSLEDGVLEGTLESETFFGTAKENDLTSFVGSEASSGSCGEHATWTLDSQGTLNIVGTGEMTDFKAFGSPWYKNSEIKTVLIESGITSIGTDAFYQCSGIKSITIPSSVTRIGGDAFFECFGLESITLPSSITYIGNSAFDSCENLTEIMLEEGLKEIGENAFGACLSLKSITIPASVEKIGLRPFAYCNSLRNVFVPEASPSFASLDGVLYDKSFHRLITCPAQKKEVRIPDSVTRIEDYAFVGCNRLSSIALPASLESIGEFAFGYCENLNSIPLPDSVTEIGELAFFYCSSLTTIRIPDHVKSIDSSTFEGCKKLTSAVLGNGITSIATSAFEGCESLTRVTLPERLTKVKAYAFYNCFQLKAIIIPASVEKIGYLAFGFYSGSDPENLETFEDFMIDDFTIYGVPGSRAQSYAKENGFRFVSTQRPTQTPTPTPCLTPSIAFPASNQTLYIGYPLTLTPVIENSRARVSYKSSSPSVATIDSSGLVTPLTKGSTQITATIKEGGKKYKAKCTLQVKKPILRFPYKALRINKNTSARLELTLVPEGRVKWSVKNKEIASVSKEGIVTGLSKGSTYVYAKAHGMKKKVKLYVMEE